jgi:hypothetical protein
VLIEQDTRDDAYSLAIIGSIDDVLGDHQGDTALIVQISSATART